MGDKPAPDASAELLARWQAGDQEAAGELWQRYAERLIALTRRRLSKKLARHIDPEDLVQSAYRSFFVAARSEHYVLKHSGDLWRLLVAITLNKLQHQFRRHSTQKRNMGLEGASDHVSHLSHLLAREPSPAEAAALADELQHILRVLSPALREIVAMCLQGYRVHEIAKATGRHVATVRRNLKRVKQYLKQRCAQSTSGVIR
jgi:RNA polymerase sigma-70 factor (ECF subfamily)